MDNYYFDAVNYYTNTTQQKYLNNKYENIFYENFSECKGMENLTINFGCNNNVEILIVYENIKDQSLKTQDIDNINDLFYL